MCCVCSHRDIQISSSQPECCLHEVQQQMSRCVHEDCIHELHYAECWFEVLHTHTMQTNTSTVAVVPEYSNHNISLSASVCNDVRVQQPPCVLPSPYRDRGSELKCTGDDEHTPYTNLRVRQSSLVDVSKASYICILIILSLPVS